MRVSICQGLARSVEDGSVEIVERKGTGHPDTLADAISERISREFSKRAIEQLGAVPNHWVDKVVVKGGACEIAFGSGRITRPIGIFIFGKVANPNLGDSSLFEDVANQEIVAHFADVFGDLLQPRDLEVTIETTSTLGAGRSNDWYKPESLPVLWTDDATSNDASICCSFAPLSPLEHFVLELERQFMEGHLRLEFPQIGSDIKILACRNGKQVELTLALPFVCTRTPSRAAYDQALSDIRARVRNLAFEALKAQCDQIEVFTNTRDTESEIYMTHCGSCVDTGDVGVVGRGNRLNGLITPLRPMSIEAPMGKNPRYHSGKLYSIVSQRIADRIFEQLGVRNEVYISARTGDPIDKPFNVSVLIDCHDSKKIQSVIEAIVERELEDPRMLTLSILETFDWPGHWPLRRSQIANPKSSPEPSSCHQFA